jgi:hypothetical protein
MMFQDTLEHVTAKSVILPKPLALLRMLWPFQRKRRQLEHTIQTRLEHVLPLLPPPPPPPTRPSMAATAKSNNTSTTLSSCGFWLQAILEQYKNYDIPSIAELMVGLLFASHKNPAIAAAQTFLMLQEHLTDHQKQHCRNDAEDMLWSRSSDTTILELLPR